jgi:hypothetical protein
MLSLRNQFSSALKATLIASAVAMSVVANNAASEGRANATVIADCVSATNTRILGFDVKWLKDDKIHVLPNSTARFTLLAGKLGWHTTWTVLLDMDAKPVLAFEAYDERLRSRHSGFARRDVPFMIRRALKACDATWLGAPSEQLVDDFLSDF